MFYIEESGTPYGEEVSHGTLLGLEKKKVWFPVKENCKRKFLSMFVKKYKK